MFLLKADEEVQRNEKILYAKMVSVVQSSGTGKSRLLTEVRLLSGLEVKRLSQGLH
jgi:ABC-type lipoprotein export system ATPase subunit